MALVIPSAALLHLGLWKLPETLISSHHLSPNRVAAVAQTLCSRSKTGPRIRREMKISRVLCSHSTNTSDEVAPEERLGEKQWTIFRSWDVPWDWKITLYVMLPYLMSIAWTVIVGPTGQRGLVQPHLQNADEVATKLFTDQLLKTMVKLSVLYVFVSPYKPFPDDIFSYRWRQPFNLHHGWMLWGAGGLIIASSAVFLIKALPSGSSTSQMQNELESLVRLLPLIGASNTRLPVHVSVIVSSAVFTLAHVSPGNSLEIFIFGMILGMVYAQTRNLLTPIAMHACWNLGVIIMLTYLQVQGYEIEKYVL